MLDVLFIFGVIGSGKRNRIYSQLALIFFCCAQMLCADVVHTGDRWHTVYLASFPRSGNHWVRYMVEEATHIATSSVYRDPDAPHLAEPFPWGGYSTDHGYHGDCRYPTEYDPVLLKTHYPFFGREIVPVPKIVICLVRHPIDAFWSFYMYRDRGGKKETYIDQEQLREFLQGWRNFYEFWQGQPGVLFIRYEDLHQKTEFYLQLILQTAGFSFNQADIERAVIKYAPLEKPLKHMHHYEPSTLEMIKAELSDLLIMFNYEI